MKILTLLILFLISCHCNHEDEMINPTLPNCIENIIANKAVSGALQTIRAQKVNGNIHYWLNTDFTQFDGVEYIVNTNCDTICSFCGECLPADCTKIYRETWQTIWKK